MIDVDQGIGTAIKEMVKGPKCIWVENQHDKSICVVVSSFKPYRILTEGGINASADGGGVNFKFDVCTTQPISALSVNKNLFEIWRRSYTMGQPRRRYLQEAACAFRCSRSPRNLD